MKYATIIFPLALPELYTYVIPDLLQDIVQVGMRVEVSLRQKNYAAIVCDIAEEKSFSGSVKEIIDVIDDKPIINKAQLSLWTWMAQYYCCTLGEVMDAAMPSALKLQSESIIVKNEKFKLEDDHDLSSDEYLVAEALTFQDELTADQLQHILNKKSIYQVLKGLMAKQVISVKENLVEKFKPRKIRLVSMHEAYRHASEEEIFEKVKRSQNQLNVIAYILSKSPQEIPTLDVQAACQVKISDINQLVKKGLVVINEVQISRLDKAKHYVEALPNLSDEQELAIHLINNSFDVSKPVLLHGVTGSGKTRIYKELIKNTIDEGKQVLYLLPEIALTTQIVERLYKVFGQDIVLSHSKVNDQERVEIWNEILLGKKIVLSARAGIFLPFTNLGLIIVDEEHDSSYKQSSPSPLYHARDVAVYLAHANKCNIVLGSATPSLESYHNALTGRYTLVELKNRYSQVSLPSIGLIDLSYERKTGRYTEVLTVPLRKAMAHVFEQQKQVILFQNRRGYVPTLMCSACGWAAACRNCDVSLTLHKYLHELTCHYCDYTIKEPRKCPECGSEEIKEKGSGTEKVEDFVSLYFPAVKVDRLDFDSARTKTSQDKIIINFANGDTQVLVGTQMVTKGFDFDDVALVGVIDADALLHMPDFRAYERTYQMLTQVAGRAGRRTQQGLVLIQTYKPGHPVLQDVANNNFKGFMERESRERSIFKFPPFYKLIHIEIKHKDINVVIQASTHYVNALSAMGGRVNGPLVPSIPRLRNLYIRNVVIKLEKNQEVIHKAKLLIMKAKLDLLSVKEYKSVRIKVDVDP
jgi:primosomal protein N' (replication factor Y) (superfamily II helicase)